MVETVPFDIILSVAVGLAVAYSSQVHLAAAPRLVPSRPLWALVLFQVLVFCPVGTYLYVVHPAWSWNYFLDPAHLPGWLGPVAIGAYAVAGIAGFIWGGRLVRAGRIKDLGRILLGSLGILLVYFAVFARQFWWVGSYAAWEAGHTGMQALPFSRLGFALGGVGPIFLGVLGWILFREWRHGQRLLAADSRNP